MSTYQKGAEDMRAAILRLVGSMEKERSELILRIRRAGEEPTDSLLWVHDTLRDVIVLIENNLIIRDEP